MQKLRTYPSDGKNGREMKITKVPRRRPFIGGMGGGFLRHGGSGGGFSGGSFGGGSFGGGGAGSRFKNKNIYEF